MSFSSTYTEVRGEHNTEADAILAAGFALADINPEVQAVALVPSGYKLEDLERFHDTPRRVKEQVTLHTLESFLEYWLQYSSGRSVIFFNRKSRDVVAVFDYHESNDKPAWGGHKATYSLPHATEWDAWLAGNNRQMKQQDFAEFVEDNVEDIARPSGAEMLEVARNLSAVKKVQFASAVNLANGDVQFKYETETHTKGQVEVPATFDLGIPVFRGGDPYKVEARLRYRISDEGELKMWYKLANADKVRDAALDQVLEVLKTEATDSRLFEGAL